VAECRERGKSTEYPDNEEGSSLPRDGAPLIGEFHEKANQHTAHHIDRQRAEGKLETLAELLHIAAEQIAKDRSDEPACADEEQCAQNVTR